MPKELTFQETLDVGIEAWNLANNKAFLIKHKLYEKELKNYTYPEITDKMVAFKLEHYTEFTNIIIDYSTENDILQVKTQNFENHFNSFLKNISPPNLK